MKPYSLDLREKIVKAVETGESSIRKAAQRFSVSKSFVQKLLTQKRTQGHLRPRKQGGSQPSRVLAYQDQLLALIEKYPDLTLEQYCECFADETGVWVSQSTMCRALQQLGLPRKKNTASHPSPKRARSTTAS